MSDLTWNALHIITLSCPPNLQTDNTRPKHQGRVMAIALISAMSFLLISKVRSVMSRLIYRILKAMSILPISLMEVSNLKLDIGSFQNKMHMRLPPSFQKSTHQSHHFFFIFWRTFSN